MEKKRVLLVTRQPLCNAGVPNVIMTLVRQLHTRFRFDILVFSCDKGDYDDEFLGYGGEIFRVQPWEYEKHKLLYPYRFFQIRRAITEILSARRYDALHCHCGLDSAPCLIAAKQAGVKVRLASAHGIYTRKGKNIILRAANWHCKKQIARNATGRLGCSLLAGQSLFLGGEFVNVLNPVDTELYRDVERLPHESLNLLQIGYYCTNKNQLFSVGVVERLRQQGIEACLRLIGFPAEEGYLESVKERIAAAGLEEYISLLPSDADKCAAFARSDFTLLPSGSEGLPLVALESQAAGVPCIMSDNVPRDADQGMGVFLPYNDTEAWCAYLTGYLDDPKRMERPDLTHLSLKAYADRIGEFYES